MRVDKSLRILHRKINNKIHNQVLRARLKNKKFAIVSNNCWGGDIYEALGVQYNTPFVGLFIFAPCYIRLLEDFWRNIQIPLKFTIISKYQVHADYPIGLLDDIEIHFLHYKSEAEARLKWERRLERMMLIKDTHQFFFKFDDRDRGSKDSLIRFHDLPFKNKLSFSSIKLNVSNNYHLNTKVKMVILPNTSKLVDVVNWINSGNPSNTLINKITFYLFPIKKLWMI